MVKESEIKTRMSFSCPVELKKIVFELSSKEGISMSTKIVEMLEFAIENMPYVDADGEQSGAINARISEMEKEIHNLKIWKKEVTSLLSIYFSQEEEPSQLN